MGARGELAPLAPLASVLYRIPRPNSPEVPMVTVGSLWIAIIVAAALVFIASSVVWMAMPWHKKDWKGLPDEEAARRAIGGGLAPGQYMVPHVVTRSMLKEPAYQKKIEEGPVVFMTVIPRGMRGMGRNMTIWFFYCLAVGGMVAYVTTRTLQPGAQYLTVFRLAGTVSWLAFGWSTFAESIWFGRPWSNTFKQLFDSLIYASLTAGAFASQWPR